MGTLSVALDLGSTRIKAAALREDWALGTVASEPAPALRGEGGLREGDALEYLRAAERVLSVAGTAAPRGTPLGITSQRSTFLLWEAGPGTPVTPMISWQDRRAADWCLRNAGVAERVTARTGLVLSSHYVGAKLASLFDTDPALRRAAGAGDLLLGTLDTWALWNWSKRRCHRIDATMAARTLLFDLDRGDWADDLLEVFGVPRRVLPDVVPNIGRPVDLPGRGCLTATVADQASGVLAAAGEDEGTALVNLGTGTFVLRPTRDRSLRPAGYLVGPVLVLDGAASLLALEGPVNGGAAAVDGHGAGPTAAPVSDPSPDALCLPDTAGFGAPSWRSDVRLTFSAACDALPHPDLRRIALEGLVFRVRQIVEDLFPGPGPDTVLVTGGLSNEPFLPAALAACLGTSVRVREESEGTLLGVARLAAGRTDPARGPGRTVEPGRPCRYLRDKYVRWREWMTEVLCPG